MQEPSEQREPSIVLCLIPIGVLIALMVFNVLLFKDNATFGPNQIALSLSALIAGLIGTFALQIPYRTLEGQVIKSISMALQAVLILFVVGSLISIWIMSGIVPLMIYYGLDIINPKVFLFVSCVVSCIVSLCTGSSWSTSGTIGIALIAIGQTFNVPVGMVAGAVISGAYFGDKMSPLSDTTNLAPAMAGTDLFTHIRHMVYSSGPAIGLALIGFLLLGFFYQGDSLSGDAIADVQNIIQANFNLNLLLLVVPLLVVTMVALRVPALPALVFGVLLGCLAALIFQGNLIATMLDGNFTLGGAYGLLVGVAADGFSIETGNEVIDALFSRGGMSSMLNTIWLIITAMLFGGMLEACGMLQKLASTILAGARGAGTLVGATVATCLFMNATASDQYIAIVVPARMFRSAYLKYGLHPKNLSRAVEDAGTVTSVLIPWNSGGAFHSGVLGVPTLSYLPFCFFNILSPIVSIFLGAMNLTITRINLEALDNPELAMSASSSSAK
ncbi:MAG: Na+/H+ antiporter NhaC [Cyanobacteria bacterium P01_F01_bin.86]